MNGVTITPSDTGKISITGLVKNISVNGTELINTPEGKVNIDLSKYPTTTEMNQAINTAISQAITSALGASY